MKISTLQKGLVGHWMLDGTTKAKDLNRSLGNSSSFRVMKFCMGRLVSKQHQIRKTIVKFIFIDMMDSFFRFQIPTKMFFHNKSGLKNIIMFIEWMVRSIKMHISTTSNTCSSFPKTIIRTTHSNTLSFTKTFLGAVVIWRNSTFMSVKRFLTKITLYVKNFSFSSPFINTFFRTVYSSPVFNLMRRNIKNFFTILTNTFCSSHTLMIAPLSNKPKFI